jgi:hypothetical protein
MEAVGFSETSGHTRSTPRHIPEDGILHSRRRENLKSYKTKQHDVSETEVSSSLAASVQ